MTAIILTFHTLIVLGLIVVVLLQRSDGGALGLGGGGGGGFMSGRGAANALTRTTSILAAIFFSTSVGLAMLAGAGESDDSIIDELTNAGAAEQETGGAETSIPEINAGDLLGTLGADSDEGSEQDNSSTDLNSVLDSLDAGDGADADEAAGNDEGTSDEPDAGGQ